MTPFKILAWPILRRNVIMTTNASLEIWISGLIWTISGLDNSSNKRIIKSWWSMMSWQRLRAATRFSKITVKVLLFSTQLIDMTLTVIFTTHPPKIGLLHGRIEFFCAETLSLKDIWSVTNTTRTMLLQPCLNSTTAKSLTFRIIDQFYRCIRFKSSKLIEKKRRLSDKKFWVSSWVMEE